MAGVRRGSGLAVASSSFGRGGSLAFWSCLVLPSRPSRTSSSTNGTESGLGRCRQLDRQTLPRAGDGPHRLRDVTPVHRRPAPTLRLLAIVSERSCSLALNGLLGPESRMDACFVGLIHRTLPSLLPSKNERFCRRGRWTRFAGRLLQHVNRQRSSRFVTAFRTPSTSVSGASGRCSAKASPPHQ